MLSEARLVDIKVHIWDEGEQPTITDFDGDFRWERISAIMEEKLAAKEYGAIIKTYYKTEFVPGGAESAVDEEIGLYYRAFTDPHRGRIIVGGASPEDTNKNYNRRRVECAQKVFTPAELYALKPVQTEYDAYTVTSYVDGFDTWRFDHEKAEGEKRLEIRRLVYENEWMLSTVWFDGKPVMIISYSGKDGEEKDKWITDGGVYADMVTWLYTFVEKTEVTGFVKVDAVIPALTEFGSHTLHDFYDVEQQLTKR
jgi:hypothetical protein